MKARKRHTVCSVLRRKGWIWALVLGLILVVSMLSLAACGEKAAEKAVEKAIEDAAKESGQNVDVSVDLGEDSGSISITDEKGEKTWQGGTGLTLPEGFPSSLVPQGANVVGVYSSGGEHSVTFQTTEDPKKLLDYYVKTLGELGYEITNKFTGEQGGQTTIAVSAEKEDSQVMVSGGQESQGSVVFSVVLIKP